MDQYHMQLDHESSVAINDYLDAVENILLEQKTPAHRSTEPAGHAWLRSGEYRKTLT